MTDVNLLSPTELRALADKKEKENKAVKRGLLKHDLYDTPTEMGYGGIRYCNNEMNHWLLTNHQKNAIIEEFAGSFDLVLSQGTPFVCFLIDGKESWFDDINYGLEEQPEEWAKQNLEHITEIK